MKKNLLSVAFLLMATVSALAQTVTGHVTAGADNSPVPGVSVIVKGTAKGTTTDADGAYTIALSESEATLSFSFIGFKTAEVAVGGRTVVDIVMEEDMTSLDEVVVTAFGVPREKKQLGYATSTIGSTSITQTAPANFASALYGKAPGVRIAATPGGATSAVNITIRGVNTITGKSQPLIVLNGVPIRDGEVTNNDYWNDQRLRGNGLLDINPEDIENISILKGASAAALYGSDAVNGVVLITTKTGKGTKGFKVDVSTSYTQDKVAYLPRYQNVRGAGAPLNVSNGGQDEAGFIYYDVDGDGTKETRGILGYSINFGPKFDGLPTMSWDGKIRPYKAQKDNYAALFQTANNYITSVAVTYGGENSNTRLSYTRQDNEGISLGSENDKNIINLNNSFQLGKKYTVDIVVNYINQITRNRPYSIDRLTNNFAGMIGRFDNGAWYQDKYKTSKGYRYVTGSNPSLTPDENIIYNGMRGDLMDYVWRVNENNSEERSDRVITTLTNTWQIVNDLKLRGRFSTDITSLRTENSNSTEVPLTFGNSGGFEMKSYNNNLMYGDIMLMYSKQMTPDFELSLMAGYSATKEVASNIDRATSGGLSTENMFDISASVNTPTSASSRSSLVKDALFGTVNVNYKDFLFVEGTVRRDRTSTMHPSNNSFVYPSINSGFVFSDAFSLPAVISYGKLRASWGIVGNYPDRYLANIAYDQNTLGVQEVGGNPVLYTTLPTSFGNDKIKPEQKNEIEIGLETKFLENRVGLDLTYYNGQIQDQILPLTIPSSSGATSVLTNIGTLRNKGIEIALSGNPIRRDFNWDITLNVARNVNIVEKLASGSTEMLHADYDGNAAQLRSTVGQPMGDFYAHPVARHANGGLIVDPNGMYKVDPNNMVKIGNAMPKAVGGLINTFTYKGISLSAVIDYRFGGYVMPTALNWMISRGLLEESVKYMDEEHGGISYYEDAGGTRIPTSGTEGPGGEKVYHDGMLLDGVKLDGTPNDYIASSADYYWTVYNWGGPQYSPNTRYELYIKENSYIKMRELALSYSLPKSISGKIGASNIQVSVFGRNLFFLYRTLKDMDAEQTTAGSRWHQNLTNVGTNPSSRTIGGSVRFSF